VNVDHIRYLVAARSGRPPVEATPETLARFATVLTSEPIRAYLRQCLPATGYRASGVAVLSADSIVAENLEAASPGQFIFPYGYLVVATSIGGNAVAFDAVEERVVWAYHDSFFDGLISFQGEGGAWIDTPEYSREAVSRAVRVIDTDVERFLLGLLRDDETERLERLDLA
jgi:hypothetical protein